MLETSLNILKKIEKGGYKAYIVGGFVRDYILGKSSTDIDINTNATPKQIKEIFPESFVPNELYGSITIIVNKFRFEITTFRKELSYHKNRKPIEIEYIDDLLEDLKRRDFTINTLCMDSNGNIIDLLNARLDIENKKIRTVGESSSKFKEDALRIMRAVRFATTLGFTLDDDVVAAIKGNKKYLNNISYNRKKEELDKIFISKNANIGVKILLDLELDKELEIYNLEQIKLSNDLIGIWSSLKVSKNYPFTKSERMLIEKIQEVSDLDNFDKKVLYTYGPYVNSIAAQNKGLDYSKVISIYNSLPINTKADIMITGKEISQILNRNPGSYIKDIYSVLEDKILAGELSNNKDAIYHYVVNNF